MQEPPVNEPPVVDEPPAALPAKALTVKFTKKHIRRGNKQRVTVSGLASGEPVRIVYGGRRIAVLKASAKGTVSKVFAVGKSIGIKRVRAFGVTNDRSGATTFRVTK